MLNRVLALGTIKNGSNQMELITTSSAMSRISIANARLLYHLTMMMFGINSDYFSLMQYE